MSFKLWVNCLPTVRFTQWTSYCWSTERGEGKVSGTHTFYVLSQASPTTDLPCSHPIDSSLLAFRGHSQFCIENGEVRRASSWWEVSKVAASVLT